MMLRTWTSGQGVDEQSLEKMETASMTGEQ